jgi:hypothetical protein
MPKKINFETNEGTEDDAVEEVEIGTVRFPQGKSARDEIKKLQDLMRDADKEPKPIFKGTRVVIDTRKGIEGVRVSAPNKKPNPKKGMPKSKKTC